MENCYICKSKRIKLHKEEGSYPIKKCLDCGLFWVPPDKITDEEIKEFYTQEYYQSNERTGYEDYASNEALHRKNARNIIKQTEKYIDLEDKKVLDIGCAYGYLLDELKKNCKSDVYGVELSEHSYSYAKNKLKLNVLNENFSPSLFKENYFDVVFLIGTIEHLHYPYDMVEKINKVLKPGGILVITTIDTKGLLPLYMYKPPEHLFYFSNKNLASMLNMAGYDKLKHKLYYVNYFFYDLFERLGHFTKLKVLRNLSKSFQKSMPDFSLKIPTNEMIMIAKKR